MASGRSITYEVYYQQNSRWHLQASFDSTKRDDAVEEAKRLEKESHLQGACVVREAYDTETNLSHESIIYSSPNMKGKPNIGAMSGADGHVRNAPEGSVAANAAREARKREVQFQAKQQLDAEKQQAEAEKKQEPALAKPPVPEMEPGAELVKIALAFLAASIGGTVVTTLCFLGMHMTGVFLGRNVTLSVLAVTFGVTFLVIFLPSLKKILAASKMQNARRRRQRLEEEASVMGATSSFPVPETGARNSVEEQVANENKVAPVSETIPDAAGEAAPLPPGQADGAVEPTVPRIDEVVSGFQKNPEAADIPTAVLNFPSAPEGRAAAMPIHVVKQDERLTGPGPMNDALAKVAAEARQYLGRRLSEDAYTRFGLILFLAGFAEPMMLSFRVSKADALKILIENVMRLGVDHKQARGFCGNVDEYLLDERYFGMYSLGRSGGNRRVADEHADCGVRDAIKVWQSPVRKKESSAVDEGSDGEEQASRFVAVLFTDIVDSTQQQQTKGDEWLMKVVHAHNDIVREALTHHQGREIKHTGDGIMASFTGVVQAVEATLAMQQGFEKFSKAMPELAFRVRAGISAGEPIHENGDIFGTPVNLAARVMSQAEGGEIAASSIVRELCRGKEYDFKQIGLFELKGFEEPQPIYHIIGAKKADAAKQQDLP